MTEYTVVIRVRGTKEYVTRRTEEQAREIAQRIEQTRRFAGYRAKVLIVLKVYRPKGD